MPNWRLRFALIALFSTACAATSDRIVLTDGRPVEGVISGVRISFDGNDELKIYDGSNVRVMSARSPAIISVTPDARHLLHNYGNGSGQVYIMAIYSIENWRRLDLSFIRDSVYNFADENGCHPGDDEISYLFNEWHNGSLEITTEDFTRRQGCSMLNRDWTFAY